MPRNVWRVSVWFDAHPTAFEVVMHGVTAHDADEAVTLLNNAMCEEFGGPDYSLHMHATVAQAEASGTAAVESEADLVCASVWWDEQGIPHRPAEAKARVESEARGDHVLPVSDLPANVRQMDPAQYAESEVAGDE